MGEGTQKFTEFVWTKPRSDAALMLAEDEFSDARIAEKVGVTRRGLAKWKQHPDFTARIQEHVADLEASVKQFAIAKKRNRVARQNADWLRLQVVREERAASPDMAAVPGGSTGLLVKQYKVIGAGPSAQLVEEYVLDTGLVRSQGELEKQAAGEVGDDATRVQIGGIPGGAPIRAEMTHVDPAEFQREFLALIGGGDSDRVGGDAGDVAPE